MGESFGGSLNNKWVYVPSFLCSLAILYFLIQWFSHCSSLTTVCSYDGYYATGDNDAHLKYVSLLLDKNLWFLSLQRIFYEGFYYASGFVSIITRLSPLSSLEVVTTILFVSLPLSIQLSVQTLTGSKWTGAFASVFFTASIPVWFASLFYRGITPNVLGIISCLLLLWALARFDGSIKRIAILAATMLLFLYGHYTNITLIPPLVMTVLIFGGYIVRRLALILFVGSIIAVFLSPLIMDNIYPNLAIPFSGFFNFLVYSLSDQNGNPLSLSLVAFALIGIYLSFRNRNKLLIAVSFWLVLLIATAPSSIYVERWFDESFFPFLILGSYGLHEVFSLVRY